MNQPIDRQQKAPSNNPGDGAAFSMMLEAMSVEELTDALNDALENMTEENYDSALIDAYLDALDRKDPPPHILEAGAAYSGFEKRIQGILPEYRNRKVLRGHRRTWRVGLVAVLTIICMFGGMMIAQAAGVDVFGAMARWTDEIFSFGTIRAGEPADEAGESDTKRTSYGSVQEALDDYQITEVCAPEVPDGYTLDYVEASYFASIDQMFICAQYGDGEAYILFSVVNYDDEPSWQIEKTDAPPESFEINGSMVCLLENTNNNTAAWMTEHYEYCIAGSVDKAVLKQIVLSTQVERDAAFPYGQAG